MGKFIIKKLHSKPFLRQQSFEIEETESVKENKDNKKENKVMNTKEKIEMASAVLDSAKNQANFKKVKKDKGLIERTESSITVLTEDNKELLKD